jgi:hypothetical protein
MSMHYLMRDWNASKFARVYHKAKEVGVAPEVIEHFVRGQYTVHDGPESWTEITDEAWAEMKRALAEKGVNIADV